MIPIYASISFLSYKFYRHAIYWEVARDCYEAFAIASFFHLMCHYVEPTLHEQKNYFRSTTPKNWVMPLNWFQPCTGGKEKGIFRIPRSGLTWFNVCPDISLMATKLTSTDYLGWSLSVLLASHHMHICCADYRGA